MLFVEYRLEVDQRDIFRQKTRTGRADYTKSLICLNAMAEKKGMGRIQNGMKQVRMDTKCKREGNGSERSTEIDGK